MSKPEAEAQSLGSAPAALVTAPRRLLRTLVYLLLAVTGALLVLAPAVAAQERAQDEGVAKPVRLGLLPSADLGRTKRERAREGFWAWTFLGATAVAYDSNVFLGPRDEQASGFTDVGARIDGRRNWGRHDFKLSLLGSGAFFSESDEIKEIEQKLQARYRVRLGDDLRFSLSVSAEHENDNAVDPFGEDFERDFEHLSYKAEPGVRYQLGEHQQLRLSYGVKRKDYFETVGHESLDYWRHGPKLRYRLGLGHGLRLQAAYDFAIRHYDENPSSQADGNEPPGTPLEEHFYHRAELQAKWRPSEWLLAEAIYGVRRKDDRFEGFESYWDQRGQLSLTFFATPSITLGTRVSYSHRDYDNRPGEQPGETLRYDKIRAGLTGHYQVSRHLAFYAGYDFVDRDTNRESGDSYLDYSSHRVLTGFSLAY